MRHRKSGRHLNRNSSHFRLMFINMVCSLFKYEQIKTTLAKAKELRSLAEPLITYSKIDNHTRRRLIFSKIRNNSIVHKLFTDIGPHFFARPGGYLRILKCGYRQGDRARVAYVQLIDRNDEQPNILDK